jgi:hypothetical protein
LFEIIWIHIVDKVAVIKRDANAVQSQGRKVRSIRICEEVVQESIKEELSFFFPDNLGHLLAVLVFMASISSNEVLHVEHATNGGALQNNAFSRGINNFATLSMQHLAG